MPQLAHREGPKGVKQWPAHQAIDRESHTSGKSETASTRSPCIPQLRVANSKMPSARLAWDELGYWREGTSGMVNTREREDAVAGAMKCLDDFMAAFNAR